MRGFFFCVKYYQKTRKEKPLTESCLISYMFNLFLWEQFLVRKKKKEIKLLPDFMLLFFFLCVCACIVSVTVFFLCNLFCFFLALVLLFIDKMKKKRILRKNINKRIWKLFWFQYGTWRVTSSNTFICSVSFCCFINNE